MLPGQRVRAVGTADGTLQNQQPGRLGQFDDLADVQRHRPGYSVRPLSPGQQARQVAEAVYNVAVTDVAQQRFAALARHSHDARRQAFDQVEPTLQRLHIGFLMRLVCFPV